MKDVSRTSLVAGIPQGQFWHFMAILDQPGNIINIPYIVAALMHSHLLIYVLGAIGISLQIMLVLGSLSLSDLPLKFRCERKKASLAL